jgi:electron transport complex protein RnfB
MIAPVLSLTLLGLTLGTLLGVAARYLRVEQNPLQDEIEALLPGSQCGQCGYPGCAAAAAAIADGQAAVTLCPPGGRALVEQLASKLGVSVDLAAIQDQGPRVAFIHERRCTGCTKCMKRCPTDAIMGGPKMIHAVFADACTGCRKCHEVCPHECIEMQPAPVTVPQWHWPMPALAV